MVAGFREHWQCSMSQGFGSMCCCNVLRHNPTQSGFSDFDVNEGFSEHFMKQISGLVIHNCNEDFIERSTNPSMHHHIQDLSPTKLKESKNYVQRSLHKDLDEHT